MRFRDLDERIRKSEFREKAPEDERYCRQEVIKFNWKGFARP